MATCEQVSAAAKDRFSDESVESPLTFCIGMETIPDIVGTKEAVDRIAVIVTG
jgi:hypothetical protein